MSRLRISVFGLAILAICSAIGGFYAYKANQEPEQKILIQFSQEMVPETIQPKVKVEQEQSLPEVPFIPIKEPDKVEKPEKKELIGPKR